MYHYIFFDLDGTLTDSKEGILNSLRYAFDKLGEPVPPESTLIKFIGPPLQDSIRGILRLFGGAGRGGHRRLPGAVRACRQV